MGTKEVAHGLVTMCKEGKFAEAEAHYYSDDIVSIEAYGDPPDAHGIEAVRKKTEWWNENFTVNDAEISGPFINGDQFAVRYVLDTTNKGSGERMLLEEVGVYIVKNDKIVYQRFFNLDA